MGYLIKSSIIDATYEEYNAYLNQGDASLLSVLCELRESVRQLSVMRTFSGDAAQAVKAYFSEYHGMFIDALEELAEQLRFDYVVKYMNRYEETPIWENGDFVLPEDELTQKADLLKDLKDEDIESIRSELACAAACAPSGFGFSFPRTDMIFGTLNAAWSEADRLKQDVWECEMAAKRYFLDCCGDHPVTVCFLRSIIEDEEDRFDIRSYQAGDMAKDRVSESVYGWLRNLASEREAAQDDYIAACSRYIDRQLVREEEAYRVAEEGRVQWEMAGICFGAIAVVGGAVATFATGGAVPALFAGAAALKGLADTAERIHDLDAGINSAACDGKEAKTLEETAAGASLSLLSKAATKFTKGKGISWATGISREVKGTVSVVNGAAKAGQVVSDANHDRMRKEAQTHLQKIEDLKKQQVAVSGSKQRSSALRNG